MQQNLNPSDDGEIVWARRMDPVRARINNILLTDSGCRYGDIVLHDRSWQAERKVLGCENCFGHSGGTCRMDNRGAKRDRLVGDVDCN
jgi:hypothetical protein